MSEPKVSSSVSPPTHSYGIAQLNEDCSVLAQKAARFLAENRQVSGSYDEAMIMSQAIYQTLSIQDAIQRVTSKGRARE